MTIVRSDYKKIIQGIKLGNSVAEKDFLLESARVETHVFTGVLQDEYELVLGRKGAGKTAIFKLIDNISPFLLARSNIVILSGVNSSGEPIFNSFKEDFKDFSEEDFENFWKIYFISLIYNEFLNDERFEAGFNQCKDLIGNFVNECYKAGIPTFPNKQNRTQIIKWIIGIFPPVKKLKVPLSYNTQTQTLFALPEIEFEKKQIQGEETIRRSIYVNNIGLILKEILLKSGFKIWIILDRLDEVFDRYSSIEFNGLRGLLKAYKSFDVGKDNDLFRIKIFLRDDIKDFLTDDEVYKKYFGKKAHIPPLPAATHIFAKQSPTLSWTEDEIEQLILNRLLSSKEMRWYLGLNEKFHGSNDDEIFKKITEEMKNKNTRVDYWNKIFPTNISGINSLKWIFSHLKDANNIVTARSVIDMLEGALDYQKRKLQINFQDEQLIFPVDSIKSGLEVASKNKLENDIYVEFPKDQKFIKALGKEGEYKLTTSKLRKMYGSDWEDIVGMLNKIGILQYIKLSGDYRIVYLFRPALQLRYKF